MNIASQGNNDIAEIIEDQDNEKNNSWSEDCEFEDEDSEVTQTQDRIPSGQLQFFIGGGEKSKNKDDLEEDDIDKEEESVDLTKVSQEDEFSLSSAEKKKKI